MIIEEIITIVMNIIAILCGFGAMFYLGSYVGRDVRNNEIKDALKDKYEYQTQYRIYEEKYRVMNHLLQNLTEEDVKMISKEGWNYFVLKKTEKSEEEEFVEHCVSALGDYR